MGVVQLTTVTAINMMGSGIILLPATLAEIGTVSIFAWILASIGATILAYAFAKCGMYSKKVGGMGGYAEYRFGRLGNFLSNLCHFPDYRQRGYRHRRSQLRFLRFRF